jgi:hypothetical protein
MVTWVMWNVVLVRLEIELASVQERCTICAECSKAPKSFWTHPMVHLVEAHLFRFEIVPILTLDRCTDCTESM